MRPDDRVENRDADAMTDLVESLSFWRFFSGKEQRLVGISQLSRPFKKDRGKHER